MPFRRQGQRPGCPTLWLPQGHLDRGKSESSSTLGEQSRPVTCQGSHEALLPEYWPQFFHSFNELIKTI